MYRVYTCIALLLTNQIVYTFRINDKYYYTILSADTFL